MNPIAHLWLAHLAHVEADWHTTIDPPDPDPFAIGHEVDRSPREGERLLQVARDATMRALQPYARAQQTAVRKTATLRWWQR